MPKSATRTKKNKPRGRAGRNAGRKAAPGTAQALLSMKSALTRMARLHPRLGELEASEDAAFHNAFDTAYRLSERPFLESDSDWFDGLAEAARASSNSELKDGLGIFWDLFLNCRPWAQPDLTASEEAGEQRLQFSLFVDLAAPGNAPLVGMDGAPALEDLISRAVTGAPGNALVDPRFYDLETEAGVAPLSAMREPIERESYLLRNGRDIKGFWPAIHDGNEWALEKAAQRAGDMAMSEDFLAQLAENPDAPPVGHELVGEFAARAALRLYHGASQKPAPQTTTPTGIPLIDGLHMEGESRPMLLRGSVRLLPGQDANEALSSLQSIADAKVDENEEAAAVSFGVAFSTPEHKSIPATITVREAFFPGSAFNVFAHFDELDQFSDFVAFADDALNREGAEAPLSGGVNSAHAPQTIFDLASNIASGVQVVLSPVFDLSELEPIEGDPDGALGPGAGFLGFYVKASVFKLGAAPTDPFYGETFGPFPRVEHFLRAAAEHALAMGVASGHISARPLEPEPDEAGVDDYPNLLGQWTPALQLDWDEVFALDGENEDGGENNGQPR